MIYTISLDAPQAPASERIADWIRQHYDSHANPLSGTWIVDGPLVADQIYTGLRPFLAPSDRLLIVKGGLEAMWHGIAADDARWLAANFPGSLSERIPGETEGLTC